MLSSSASLSSTGAFAAVRYWAYLKMVGNSAPSNGRIYIVVHPETGNNEHALPSVGWPDTVRNFAFWYRWAVEIDLAIDEMLMTWVDACMFVLMVVCVGNHFSAHVRASCLICKKSARYMAATTPWTGMSAWP
jgi:hypothetical protein